MRQKSPLAFAAWEPDKSAIAGAAAEAKGVVSIGGRYAPDQSFKPLKPGAAIGDRALGGRGFYEGGTTARIFVGDAARLYELQARVPVDISRIGGYTANPDWGWSFEQFGEHIIATARGLDQLQYFTLGSSATFEDIDTGPGPADTVFRIREFLFTGRGVTLRNCAFNNFTDWEPDSGTQATIFDLPGSGGDIVSGVGGQFGLVFQERKVHRLTYQGSSGAPFQRDEIEDKRGALGPHAVTRFGAYTFFASDDGIRVTDGSGPSEGIGEGKIDRYFASRLNYVQRHRVTMAVDVQNRLLRIAFPAGGSDRCNELLTYSMADGRWTHDDCELDYLFESPRPGVAINDDEAIAAIAGSSIIDEVDIPVDSLAWRESRKQVMGVGWTGEVGTFEGENRPAVIETGFAEVLPGRMGLVTEVWPLIDAENVSVQITTKLKRLSDQTVNHPVIAMNADGICPVLVEARWIRVQTHIPHGADWTEASGIDWDAGGAGEL